MVFTVLIPHWFKGYQNVEKSFGNVRRKGWEFSKPDPTSQLITNQAANNCDSFLSCEAIFIQTTYYIVSLQVIAVVCGGLSILLLIISIASTAWLEADMYRQGLWEECDTLENGDVDCRKNETTGNLSCSIQWQNQKKISRYIPLSFWDSRHRFWISRLKHVWLYCE